MNCGCGSGLRLADIALLGSRDGILGGFCASSEHDEATCDGRLLPAAGYAASLRLLAVSAEGRELLAPSDDIADLAEAPALMADNLCLGPFKLCCTIVTFCALMAADMNQ